MSDTWRTQRVLLLTLDPVHIGTGGHRLGRVDQSIVREPGTNLPKIPGTSLSGAVRAYAAYRYESPGCAGQGQANEKTGYKGHCGNEKCPICYTFGSLKTKGKDQNGEENQQAHAGVVSLCDAHVLFFPVHSLAGPIWASTKARLEEFGFEVDSEPAKAEECVLLGEEFKQDQSALNLGWLMLETRKEGMLTLPPGCELDADPAWQVVAKRIVLVSDKVFSQVVNSNLEVRTSVAIDPTTGAAQEGALFTYEALPRATWLVMDVVIDDYRRNGEKPWPVEKKAKLEKDGDSGQVRILHNAGEPLGETWTGPSDVVRAGLELIKVLGVGGMGTRGFGRMRPITDWAPDGKGAADG